MRVEETAGSTAQQFWALITELAEAQGLALDIEQPSPENGGKYGVWAFDASVESRGDDPDCDLIGAGETEADACEDARKTLRGWESAS